MTEHGTAPETMPQKTVMTFGTFDIVHSGHEYYLNQAKKYGDYLVTVVATDRNVIRHKSRPPHYDEQKRRSDVEALGISDMVRVGNENDPYLCIREHNPDVICLGYDQYGFTEGLSAYMEKTGTKIEIVRLDPYDPHIYKSSLLRKKMATAPRQKTDAAF